MNLYFLVEGRRTERKVYRTWIQHIFPELKESDRIEDVKENNFYIISGGGYPYRTDNIGNTKEEILNLVHERHIRRKYDIDRFS